MAQKAKRRKAPIKFWSHSSLMTFLRNPLAWYKRYVELIYDIPSTPSGIVGRAAHTALQHYYSGLDKEPAIELGLEYMRNVADFEINFGKKNTKKAIKEKRAAMEREYLQAVGFYLEKPPKHDVVGVEVKATAEVGGLALPIKAVSDLVVKSRIDPQALDIVDHKFVDSWSPLKENKTVFILQAIFNYYTVKEKYGMPVRRFIIVECKKTKNRDGRPQLRRYYIKYDELGEEFKLFRKLINDATKEICRPRVYLPNPSDLFEGENSFDVYRLGLVEEVEE